MKCHYHPRANAITLCSACSTPLCKRCTIEDKGHVYCDDCYTNQGNEELVHAERALESDDYMELEMMELLDGDDDDGLI